MSRFRNAWMIAALGIALSSCIGARQGPALPEAARWRADLAFVVDTIIRGHAAPFHSTSEAAFRAAAARLDVAIPRLQRYEIIVELGKLVATIGDGHTRLPWPWNPVSLGFHTLPVRFESFADGWFVVAAAKPYEDLVGGRVVRLGRLSVNQALQAVTPLVSRDNTHGIARIARRLLAIPEVLVATGVGSSLDGTALAVDLNGVVRERWVESVAPGTLPPLRDLYELTGIKPALHRSAPGRFAWQTFLDGGATLYAQINAVSNEPGQPTLPAFCAALLASIDTTVRRIVVDLRHNGGGSRELLTPCVEGLAQQERINRSDRLYVVIGHETFSAGMWVALDFANRTAATLVGEPTAGRPNFYGETRSAETPMHHLPFTWASRMNWRTDRGDQSESLMPTIVIRETFGDYAAGRDPVLDLIRRR